MVMYCAYVESIDHKVKMLCGNYDNHLAAARFAEHYIREHASEWDEHDRLVIATEIFSSPVMEVISRAD